MVEPLDDFERINMRAALAAQYQWQIGPMHLLQGCLRMPDVIEMFRLNGFDADDVWRNTERAIEAMPTDERGSPGRYLSGECLRILEAAMAMGERSAVNVVLAIANHASPAGDLLRDGFGIKDWTINKGKRAA